MRRLLPLAAIPALLVAVPAAAHPKLVASTPAAQATVAPVSRIELTFSEKLVAPMAGATLDMTEMPGMRSHPPMRMKIATAVAPDGVTLVATTVKPLPKGGYRLDYHVVSADTHRVEGALAFTVR